MFARRLRGRQQPITQLEIGTELNRSGLGIEKPVRPAFDRKAVAAVRPHCPPDMILRFKDGHVGVGPQNLQSKCETQAADAGADDDDPGHGGIVVCNELVTGWDRLDLGMEDLERVRPQKARNSHAFDDLSTIVQKGDGC
jgi:hypothetical protein